MRAIAMCLSVVQWRWHALANSCFDGIHRLCGRSSFRTYCSISDLEGGYIRRYSRKPVNKKAGGSSRSLRTSPEIVPVTRTKSISSERKIDISRTTSPVLMTYRVEAKGTESDEYYNELAKLATIICFDIETTGFSRERDRIVEFACQDLRGGQNSTFQTLVNPERDVPNEHIHGISTRMVNRRDVPRMKDLIPILVEYIESRKMPGGVVVLVSHNGRTFDVPFLKKEFIRCSYEIPLHWLFSDTYPLCRTLTKSLDSQVPLKNTLQAMREYYKIPLIGPAHRALSDVHSLALVFQRLTFDLKIPISRLIQDSFK